jgi:WD40 repeat protein
VKKSPARINALAFSPDNRSLFSGSAAGEVVFWDVAGARVRFAANQSSVAVLTANFNNERELAAATADGKIMSWDVTTGKQKSVIVSNNDAPEILFASFSKDGSLVASGTGGRQVEIYRAVDGKLAGLLESHATGFLSVAFSRDGRWLASSANDRTIRLWQVVTRDAQAVRRHRLGPGHRF